MAIGTFHPEIEIWNTDVLDALEPEAVLGGLVAGKRRTLKPGSHRQAVMGLSWNREYRNVLASSSADSTVKLWDVTSQHCMLTLNYHKDKVPVVHFHPVEANILLTASYDRVCAVTDGRSPSNGTWIGIPAKPESAAWDLAAPYCFFVSIGRSSVDKPVTAGKRVGYRLLCQLTIRNLKHAEPFFRHFNAVIQFYKIHKNLRAIAPHTGGASRYAVYADISVSSGSVYN